MERKSENVVEEEGEFHDCREESNQEEEEASGSNVDSCSSNVDHQSATTKADEYFIDETFLEQISNELSQEEKCNRKEEAIRLKSDGNGFFANGEFEEAADRYSSALRVCPSEFKELKSILYSNRAACLAKIDLYEKAIDDCNRGVEFDANFTKVLLRRAQLYEKKEEHFDKALEDFQLVLRKEPANKIAREAVLRLPVLISERNEKMKGEMLGKLKELGNMVLRPFGLSTDNFKLDENPGGGYSVKIQK